MFTGLLEIGHVFMIFIEPFIIKETQRKKAVEIFDILISTRARTLQTALETTRIKQRKCSATKKFSSPLMEVYTVNEPSTVSSTFKHFYRLHAWYKICFAFEPPVLNIINKSSIISEPLSFSLLQLERIYISQ